MLELGCPAFSLALSVVDLETENLKEWGRVLVPHPQVPLDPEKLGPLLSSAAQGLALSQALLILPFEEWTLKVALGSGLSAQPPDGYLGGRPASLSPERPHPS